jgi:acetyltransferase-like isoleucine patch superfamily enzyme
MLPSIAKKQFVRLAAYWLHIRTIVSGFGFRQFGKNNVIHPPVKIHGKEWISVGDSCSINAFVHIWGTGGVQIGNRVMIASHVAISSLTHDHRQESMRHSPVVRKSIVIEDDVWIGAGAVILPGIKLGTGSVVGAGAIVTKDVPPLAIVVGNPARIINMRQLAKSSSS